jgi:hypothetical protein
MLMCTKSKNGLYKYNGVPPLTKLDANGNLRWKISGWLEITVSGLVKYYTNVFILKE